MVATPAAGPDLPDGCIRAGDQIVSDGTVDANRFFKPMLDLIWNSAGYRCCPAYDGEGNFVEYKEFQRRL